MGTNRHALDGELHDCLLHAKVLAIREGSKSVTGFHLVKAAALCRPEDTKQVLQKAGVSRTGSAASPALATAKPTANELRWAEEIRLRLAPEVASAMRGLGASGEAERLQLGQVLTSLVSHPALPIGLTLESLGLETPEEAGAATTLCAPYGSLREFLEDQIALWVQRTRAAHAFHSQVQGQATLPTHVELAKLAALEEARERRYWVTDSSVLRDPLGFRDLPRAAREILTCLFMEELYDLDACSFFRPECRQFAAWLAPERYPANCSEVLAATRKLYVNGQILTSDPWPELVTNLALSLKAVDRLAAALERGPIAENEVREFGEHLRKGE